MVNYFYLITLLPLAGFLVNGLFGAKIKNEKVSGIIGSLTILGSFVISLLTFLHLFDLLTDMDFFSQYYDETKASRVIDRIGVEVRRCSTSTAQPVT